MLRDPTFLLVHGWGFDASLWGPLCRELGDCRIAVRDCGYFGTPVDPPTAGPVVAVGHSLGSLLLLREPPKDCRALVAINGFDRFTERPDAPGVPRRLVERMIARFADAPAEVLDSFRERVGAPPAPAIANPALLLEHLKLLRDADERTAAAAFAAPILSLQAGDDPLLPPELRASVFAAASCRYLRPRPDGGHCLPLTRPGWCAQQIRTLLAELA